MQSAQGNSFFGTDGIRSIFGQWPLVPESIQRIGYGVACYLKERFNKKHPVILMGCDTRWSCHELKMQFCHGAAAAPSQVLDLGVCSSPAVAFLTSFYQADIGVVISASHNSAAYNGIKFFSPQGGKLPLEEESFMASFFEIDPPYSSQDITPTPQNVTPYLQHLVHLQEHSLQGLSIALDTAHGALHNLAFAAFQSYGATVKAQVGREPNGHNINQEVGSLHPQALSQLVQESKCDWGFAFDGDGDRVAIVDREGRVWNGDHILAVLSRQQPGAVGTIMSNWGLEQSFQQEGRHFVRADVGDRSVFEHLQNHGFRYGGEPSGHIIDRRFLPTGDGLWIALCLAQIAASQGLVFPTFREVPWVNVNLTLDNKRAFETEAVQATLRKYHDELYGKGRLVVRVSGTEPVVRILVEGPCQETNTSLLQRIKNDLRAML